MDKILILDFGGQYNQLIARRVRECNVYCEVKPYTMPLAEIRAFAPKGIIFTGGPHSVYAADSPQVDPEIFALGLPILGICYGCQLMAQTLGGRVTAASEATAREFGKTNTYFSENCKLFAGLPAESITWMSHGDYLAQVPDGFQLVAHTDACPTAAIADESRGFYGVQFHPEVNHTVHGQEMLRNFLYAVCQCDHTWTMRNYMKTAIADVREKVGDGKVLLALSGGVDSSVAAALLAKAVGERLTCIFVDHGLLRKNEGDEVEAAFRDSGMHFIRVNAQQHFMERLAGVEEPERKRKIIGEEFIRVFEAESKKIGHVDFLAQGTIYPDVIESGAGMRRRSNRTTMSAVCRIMSTSGRSSSRCGCCIRTRCGSWAGSWACRRTLSCGSRSRARAWPFGSSARSPGRSWKCCGTLILSSGRKSPTRAWPIPSTSILPF